MLHTWWSHMIHIIYGRKFYSKAAMAEEYKVSASTITRRFQRGLRGEQLVARKQLATPPPPRQRITINGIGYKSVTEACNQLDVPQATFYERLRRGATLQQALGLSPLADGRKKSDNKKNHKLRKKNSTKIKVQGVEYHTYVALADAYKLPRPTVYQRIKVYGYSPLEAVTSSGKFSPIIVNGRKYRSRRAAAKAHGVSPEIFSVRMQLGQTPEEALRLELRAEFREVRYDGVLYRDLKQLAENFNIPPATLRARIRGGMSIPEAITAGVRIPSCGRYSLKKIRANPNLAWSPAFLYFARIVVKGVTTHKIGITTRSPKHRLTGCVIQEIIKSISGTLLNCYILEQKLLAWISHGV